MSRFSLRGRLSVVIIGAMTVVGVLSALVRYTQFEDLSRRLYDDTLFTVASTISRDVIINDGDLLTKSLLDALVRSLGDTILYKITGPGGAFVTGYSDAPKVPDQADLGPGRPIYFDAVYAGQPVRVLFMTELMENPQPGSLVTVEVWQTIRRREDLSLGLFERSAIDFGMLIAVAAVLIWFGIGYGLRPLKDIEAEILKRSPDEMQPIRKGVPAEIETLITAMNGLFGRLAEAFAIRNAFISDAAHQVRTPIAAIQAQAEAALTARSEEALRLRVQDLATAARHAGRLTNQLLSLERLRGRTIETTGALFDLEAVVRATASSFAERLLPRGFDVAFEVTGAPRMVFGDPVSINELLTNLLDNAEKYGTADHPEIAVHLRFCADRVELEVEDNGPGIAEAAKARVFDRFFRAAPDSSIGCGLGLSIVRDVARLHGGDAVVTDRRAGCAILVFVPSPVDEAETQVGQPPPNGAITPVRH